MITYKPTETRIQIPEIKGYQKEFSRKIYTGDQQDIVPVEEQDVEKSTIQQPTNNEWSDIRSIIKQNEGFVPVAQKSFNEPYPTVGYGFFNTLPDGTKITEGMILTKAQADRQLDIAIANLSNKIQNSLDSYNLKISKEQFNILLDLGYHGGAGLVDKLLKEANGNTTKIGSLLNRYATKAKYGDTSIINGLKQRALRRSEGWINYPLKAKYGLKLPNILYNI